MLATALGVEPERLFAYPETLVSKAAGSTAAAMLDRRVAGEPLGRILGYREFWSLRFALAPDVLEPRPDTETLVSVALDLAPKTTNARVLDLGVGSGCILLALLSERPEAAGIGVDRSAGAVRVARANAMALGLDRRARFLVGDWGNALGDGQFDLIVTNPPYVPEGDARLDAAARDHDPAAALFGGADGLDAYRAILPDLRRLTSPAGWIVVEIGAGQADAVTRLGEAAGLAIARQEADLAGHVRCLVFSRA